MAANQEVFDEIKELIIQGKGEKTKALVTFNLDKIDPVEIIEKGMAPAMVVVGEKFESEEIYLPEMINAANIFEEAMVILKPKILESGKSVQKIGTIVIGTVSTDIHEIGKNIVANMISTGGFEVFDLGADVPAFDFIKKAEEVNANIIAVSALMTTTIPYQKDIIDLLKSMGLREKYKVIVGGGAVTAEWAEEICADGYAESAPAAVKLAKRLLNK